MPTVFWKKGFRFFFVSFDCYEPRHIHVLYNNKECKFWLRSKSNIVLADNYKFNNPQLNFIKKTIFENYDILKNAWDEHCKNIT